MATVRGPEDIRQQRNVAALLWHALNHVEECSYPEHFSQAKLQEAMYTLGHLIDLLDNPITLINGEIRDKAVAKEKLLLNQMIEKESKRVSTC